MANVRNYYSQFQAQVDARDAPPVETSPAVAYQMQVSRVLQQQQMPPPGYGGYPPPTGMAPVGAPRGMAPIGMQPMGAPMGMQPMGRRLTGLTFGGQISNGHTLFREMKRYLLILN